MKDLLDKVKKAFRDPEYAEIYSESFQDTYLASQIKVIREQRGLSQAELGALIGTSQGGVSRIEDASYSSWSVKTLKKIAKALRVRLRISFETFGSLSDQMSTMSADSLMRSAHENDPVIFPEKAKKSNVVSMDQAQRATQHTDRILGRTGLAGDHPTGARRFPPHDVSGYAATRDDALAGESLYATTR